MRKHYKFKKACVKHHASQDLPHPVSAMSDPFKALENSGKSFPTSFLGFCESLSRWDVESKIRNFGTNPKSSPFSTSKQHFF